MKIGIEINGVLRNTLLKIKQEYEKWYIDNQIHNEEDEDFTRKVFSDITTLDLKKHLAFKDDDEVYNFLYREHTMEIFGHAGSTENSSMIELNDLYTELREKHDIIIVSDEIGKSKPASLFFLSKFGCLVENVKFYSEQTIHSLWNSVDVLLTANPNLLLKCPHERIVYKYKTKYNEDIKSEYEVSSITEFKEKIKNLYD